MKGILSILWNEIHLIFFRDIRRGILLICAASAYLLLFSWLYTWGIVNHIPLLIVDQDQSSYSRNLSEKFATSDVFDGKYWGSELTDVEDFFQTEGRHSAALVIPKGFAKNIQHERQSQVLVIADGSNIIISNNTNIAAFDIIQAFNQEIGEKLIARDVSQVPYLAERRLSPVRFSYRVLGNPELDYMRFFVFGLALIAMQQGILLAVSASILWPKNHVTEAEWALSPWKRWLVKSFVYWFFGMMSYILFLEIGKHFFYLPVNGTWREHLLLAGSFIFCLVQLGALLACVVKDELLFSRLSVSYTVPAFILSGFTWPLPPMPDWVQFLAHLSPYTYVAEAARNLYIYGSYYQLERNSALLLAVGLLAFPLASHLYSKRLALKKEVINEK